MYLVIRKHSHVGRGECGLSRSLHQPQRLAHHVQIVAEVRRAVGRHVLELLVKGHLVADVAHQGAQGQHGVRVEILGTDVGGQIVARIGYHRRWIDVLVENLHGLLRRGQEVLGLGRRDGAIQGVGGGHRSDQDQHDESHAFLSEPHQGRKQQGFADGRRLGPVDSTGALPRIHQLIRDADADNGADHGVRTRGRQPEVPGADIPKDGGDQESKNHCKARPAAHLQDQFHRQQSDDGECDQAAGKHDTNEVAKARPRHG